MLTWLPGRGGLQQLTQLLGSQFAGLAGLAGGDADMAARLAGLAGVDSDLAARLAGLASGVADPDVIVAAAANNDKSVVRAILARDPEKVGKVAWLFN